MARDGDGYFGKNSMFWRVWRERVQLLGATRAVLLQVAHPLIAAGVGEHSNFKQDPLGRLQRTLDTMLTIVFGSKAQADLSLKHLGSVHQPVKGELKEKVGPFPSHTSYSANDPELKLWVHATLMDTGLLIHQQYIETLSNRQKRQFYEESKVLARLMRIPDEIVPQTLDEFNDYFNQQLESEEIIVGPQAKKIAQDLLHPSLMLVSGPLMELLNSVTSQLLPDRLRQSYGLTWNKRDQMKVKMVKKTVKSLLPLSPSPVRFMSQYSKLASSKIS